MSAPELTLLIPGLFGPRDAGWGGLAAAGLPVAALEHLLARADAVPAGGSDLAATLCEYFGLSAAAALPVAPLTLRYDGGTPGVAYWLRADPVHLRVGQDKVVLTPAADLHADEAAGLCEAIRAPLAEEGLRLFAPTPARWYLSLPQVPAVRFAPLDAVLGRDVRAELPQGEEARAWRRRLNEIQMLLHASGVNRRRAARGQSEINSVWLWGGGTLPPAGVSRVTHAWGADALLGGLALHAGLTPRPLPAAAAAWLDAAEPGRHLILLDALAAPVALGEPEAWRDALGQLLAQWLDPLWTALRRGRLEALAIGGAGPLEYHATPRRARRWWRRTRPFATYLGGTGPAPAHA